MSTKSNETLQNMIENLTEKVESGFRGVHERQDYTNGKVSANTEFRIKTEASINTFKWLFGFLGIGNIIIFLKVVLNVI